MAEVNSNAPQCSSVDDLLLKLSNLTADQSFWNKLNEDLSGLPPAVTGAAGERIRNKLSSSRGQMKASDENTQADIALLLLSSKSETGASEKFRYCEGNFTFNNGQALQWSFSLATEDGRPVMRLLGTKLIGSVSGSTSSPASGTDTTDLRGGTAPQNYAEAPEEEQLEEPEMEEIDRKATEEYERQMAEAQRNAASARNDLPTSGTANPEQYVRMEFIQRDPPPPFVFPALRDDTNRVNQAGQGIRITGVNLPCNTYHVYVDKPPEQGVGVARDVDLCQAQGFWIRPGEVYTLRNRSPNLLLSRNIRVEQ